MKKIFTLLTLLVTIVTGAWAETQTIKAGTVESGAFTYSDLTEYTYGGDATGYWTSAKLSNKVISILKGSFTITNKGGVTITGITVNGVSENNASGKTATITISDGVNTATTGSQSWNGRQSATPSSFAMTGVSGLNMAANTEYTVSVASAEKNMYITIDITYTAAAPSTENITFTDVATYVTTNALDFSEVTEFTAYAVTAVGGGKATTQSVGKVPAGTALLLKATGAVNVNVPVVADADPITNLLKASTGTGAVAAGGEYFAYSKTGNEFRLVQDGVTIPAGKAYLQVAGGAISSLSVDFGEVTAVQNVEAAPEAEKAEVKKAFVNGQFVILTENGFVNALGQSVK